MWYDFIYYIIFFFLLIVLIFFLIRLVYFQKLLKKLFFEFSIKLLFSLLLYINIFFLFFIYNLYIIYENYTLFYFPQYALHLYTNLIYVQIGEIYFNYTGIYVYYFPFIYIFIIITTISIFFCLSYNINELTSFVLYCVNILIAGSALFFTDSLILFFFAYELLLIPSFFILYKFAKTRRCIEAAYLMFF